VKPTLRVAVCQMNAGEDPGANVEWIERHVRLAAAQGADLVCFPENATQLAPSARRLSDAESIPGPVTERVGQVAKSLGIGVMLGSISEVGPDAAHSWNTTVYLAPDGSVGGTYRKIHLFDVDVAGDTSMRESDSVAAGPWQPVVVDLLGWRLGLSICYDLRFPELYRALVDAGADVLMIPAAFTHRTGASHWEVLLRARAIESQCWVVASAQTGRHYGTRESWGHAMVVDPWGVIRGQLGSEPGMLVVELDAALVQDVRRRLPSLTHRRADVVAR
jgi:predicted amidohydrolase